MRFIKKHLLTIIIGLLFIIGVCVLLYPTVANWWNGQRQSRVVASYDKAVEDMREDGYSRYYAEAQAYNEELYIKGSPVTLLDPDIVKGYDDVLHLTSSGVMGYITIDKIGVNLPIYHGTEEATLAAGAGHMQGSSLPVGGENTHSVISAHSGLPSSKMFTDLDKLEVGDTFELHVLGDTLVYEIDQIVTVLPTEFEEMYIQKGEDLCTLMTCTPYGINTHRLLVRGHRITYESEEEEIDATSSAGSNRIIIIAAAVIGAAVLVIVLSQTLVMFVRKKR